MAIAAIERIGKRIDARTRRQRRANDRFALFNEIK